MSIELRPGSPLRSRGSDGTFRMMLPRRLPVGKTALALFTVALVWVSLTIVSRHEVSLESRIYQTADAASVDRIGKQIAQLQASLNAAGIHTDHADGGTTGAHVHVPHLAGWGGGAAGDAAAAKDKDRSFAKFIKAEEEAAAAQSELTRLRQQNANLLDRVHAVEREREDAAMGAQGADTVRHVRTAVVTHLKPHNKYGSQLLNWMYPSWLWVTSQRHLAVDSPVQVIADLMIFTPDVSLAYKPPDCHVVKRAADIQQRRAASPGRAQCFFVMMADPTEPIYFKVTFLQSLWFTVSPIFNNVVLDSGLYDYFLRVDMDALLSPGLLTWAPPPKKAAIGIGYMGENVTFEWIRDVTLQHGYKYANTVQLTWTQTTLYYPVERGAEFNRVMVR